MNTGSKLVQKIVGFVISNYEWTINSPIKFSSKYLLHSFLSYFIPQVDQILVWRIAFVFLLGICFRPPNLKKRGRSEKILGGRGREEKGGTYFDGGTDFFLIFINRFESKVKFKDSSKNYVNEIKEIFWP